MAQRIHGSVRQWNDARGFGFIEPADGTSEVFVHVTEFPQGARPQVGDVVSFEVGKDDRGRRRALAIQVPPARMPRARTQRSARTTGQASSPGWAPVVLLAVLAGVGTYAYPDIRTLIDGEANVTAAGFDDERNIPPEVETTSPKYNCDGRTHCSQMSSCEEATFFVRHCPGTQMDGDGDGVPCERQHCG